MTTEAKIDAAFKHYLKDGDVEFSDFDSFVAGYMALLNELEWASGYNALATYYLPEGVEKS